MYVHINAHMGKDEYLKAYTTALGTKAYILDSASFEASFPADDNSVKKTAAGSGAKYHCTLPLRSQRSVMSRKRKLRGSNGLLFVPQRNSMRSRMEKRGENRFLSPSCRDNKSSGKSYVSPWIADDCAHLLPTTVVVPPLSNSASLVAPLPASLRSTHNVEQEQEQQKQQPLAAVDMTIPSVVGTTPPLPMTQAAAPAVPAPVTSSADDLAISLMSPSVGPYGHFGARFPCTVDDHHYMMENGFAYCPECGVKLRHGGLVEYSPADCPVNHEEQGKRAGKTSKYCFLCGALMGMQSNKPQEEREENKKDVNAPGTLWQPRQTEEILKGTPGATQSVKTPHPPVDSVGSVMNQGIAGEKMDDKKPDFGIERNMMTPPQAPGEIRHETFTSNPINITAGTDGNNMLGHGRDVTESFAPIKPGSFPLHATPRAAAVLPPRNTTVEDKLTRTSIPMNYTSSSHPGGEAKFTLSSSQDMLYTDGVPGVSCGLPLCSLCKQSVGVPLPPVMSRRHHLREGGGSEEPSGASVVVVHNHYYHKM